MVAGIAATLASLRGQVRAQHGYPAVSLASATPVRGPGNQSGTEGTR
jgi:hypothetical protein